MFNGLDFSQFDRDNMNRWLTIGCLNEANAILGAIQKSPRAGEAAPRIATADGDAAAALASCQAMDYAGAHAMANSAYRKIVAAAAQINVIVEPQSYQADYKSKGVSSKFVDIYRTSGSAPFGSSIRRRLVRVRSSQLAPQPGMCESQLVLNDVDRAVRGLRRFLCRHASEVSHLDGLRGSGIFLRQRLQRRVQIEHLH
jgi:hypothetical protein